MSAANRQERHVFPFEVWSVGLRLRRIPNCLELPDTTFFTCARPPPNFRVEGARGVGLVLWGPGFV